MRHGRDSVESPAAEGHENGLTVREYRELLVVEDGELDRGKVQPLTGLADEIAYLEVGLGEVWGRCLS